MEVNAADPLTAWWKMTAAVVTQPRFTGFHTVARIGTGDIDAEAIRLVDELLASRQLQSVETVANTIFPAAMAHGCADVAELGDRYRTLYPRLRQFSKNKQGTYFGRLVAYPIADGTKDQLAHTVDKLRTEAAGNHLSSRYECSIYHPESDSTQTMGFPCLSSCAFHLDAHTQTVHLLATYRNQYLVERGLGNYIGLTNLRNYVAREARLEPGELMVVAGHAVVDGAKTPLRLVLDRISELVGET